jgi:hypothetical protein
MSSGPYSDPTKKGADVHQMLREFREDVANASVDNTRALVESPTKDVMKEDVTSKKACCVQAKRDTGVS